MPGCKGVVRNRKKPSDSVSFVMKAAKEANPSRPGGDLDLAVKALRKEDPNSLLALAAEWRLCFIHTVSACNKLSEDIQRQIAQLPEEVTGAICLISMANSYLECSGQLEALLEKRGYKNEI